MGIISKTESIFIEPSVVDMFCNKNDGLSLKLFARSHHSLNIVAQHTHTHMSTENIFLI